MPDFDVQSLHPTRLLKMKSMTYAGTGVDYDAMDPFKRGCQQRGARTSNKARRFGLVSLEWTRGESVHVMFEQASSSSAHRHFGHVEEGLGTKNKVADAMYELTGMLGKSYYDQIAQDTVAMIVNDMVTLGIFPTTVAMHLAVGSSDWFKDEQRSIDLIEGWGKACDEARCVWSGGETPTLSGLPYPVLAGSAAGVSKTKEIIDPKNIRKGDVIIMVESSGIHANGLTMARKIADKWATQNNPFEGYRKELSDGRLYGEALLDPTYLYVGLVEDTIDAGVFPHYTVNITGHGWRKLMRANQPFTYVIEKMPPELPIFDFIHENGPVEEREMFGNFNMGAGFALYVAQKDVVTVIEVAERLGLYAWAAGYIAEGDKKVVINPLGLEFAAGTLSVR